MGVMHVRHMRVSMTHTGVAVAMRMRFTRRVIRIMRMLVMVVMRVRVRMLHQFMFMLVLVILGQVQPDAEAHQEARSDQLQGYWFAKRYYGGDRADEWRGRKIRTGTCRSQMAKCDYEQRQTHAIAEEAYDPCNGRRGKIG